VNASGQHLKLSPIEYQLVKLLAQNHGKIVTRQHILREVWGPHATGQAQYLRVYIGHLRRKLVNGGVHIQNEQGIGYRMVPEE
jgi:two-component system KDP operon response regulator KdpE